MNSVCQLAKLSLLQELTGAKECDAAAALEIANGHLHEAETVLSTRHSLTHSLATEARLQMIERQIGLR